MRKKLFLVAVCILGLPLWCAPSQGAKLTNSAPFATVAIAGHVYGGNAYCECDTANCVCDSGEQSQGQSITTSDSQQGQSKSIYFDGTATNEVGLGFLVMTTLLLWLKMRTY